MGIPGLLTWEAEDGRGYPEGINALGQEGEEAEEEKAGCDHHEGQHCPVLSVQDNLWGQGQSEQSTQSHHGCGVPLPFTCCVQIPPSSQGDHPPAIEPLGIVPEPRDPEDLLWAG